MPPLRIVLLADTHLGFDLPMRPRIERRRRGHDFFANFERVIDAALAENVNAVVHGGDLLYRSRVPPQLVQQAVVPLKRLASRGIPVLLVPGNHERSRIPHALLVQHERLHVFDRPRTFVVETNGMRVALAGFPFCRDNVRGRFAELVASTGGHEVEADIRFLCAHQSFDGAAVGPTGYVFRYARDVVDVTAIPVDYAAVLAGHIHRHQVLTEDLSGRRLRTPVLYPGSIERTSFAERGETKGYLLVTADAGRLKSWEFRRLPAREMIVRDVEAQTGTPLALETGIRRVIASAPSDAVLRLRIHGPATGAARAMLSAPRLRAWAPSTMNIEAVFVDERGQRSRERPPRMVQPTRAAVAGLAGGGSE